MRLFLHKVSDRQAFWLKEEKQEAILCSWIQEVFITLMDAHSLVIFYSHILIILEWRKTNIFGYMQLSLRVGLLCGQDRVHMRQAIVRWHYHAINFHRQRAIKCEQSWKSSRSWLLGRMLPWLPYSITYVAKCHLWFLSGVHAMYTLIIGR